MTKKNTRRKFSAKLKFQIVLEAIRGERPIAEIARQYQINPNLIGRWKGDLLANGHQLFESPTTANDPDKKVEELQKLIGKQTIEIELLKNFLGHYA